MMIVSLKPVILILTGEPMDVTKILEYNKKDHAKYGPIWRAKFPGFPHVVSSVIPEDAETMFRSEVQLPQRPGFEVLKKYRGERTEYFTSMGILGNGETWWKTRSIAQPALLKPKNVMDYVPALGQISDDFIERCPPLSIIPRFIRIYRSYHFVASILFPL